MRTLLTLLAFGIATPLPAADPFEFKDGDRVVLLGSTFIEREQKYGYMEYMWTVMNPDKNVKFRNLGWSGDTVWGEARNGFDQSPKGYERLVQVTKDAKPTVIVICYGHNESFEGKAGVPKFTAQLEKLLNDLALTKARIVLMSPTPFQKAGPITDPTPRNKNLALYRDAMKWVADKQKLEFFDLYERYLPLLEPEWIPATDNGIHLSDSGYINVSFLLYWKSLTELNKNYVEMFYSGEVRNALFKKIIEKNQLVFHQWRPQNETYLFLFRKHEQGNNAKDIPAFDPLIAKAEKEIQELKKALAK